MKESYYGRLKQVDYNSKVDLYVEEIKNNGFTIIEGLLDEDELLQYRKKIDAIYKIQETEFGKDRLHSIQETNVCRMPLKYDDYFINIATKDTVLNIVEKFLGRYFILNLQNAIINTPKEEHHQSAWHRDLPYQNFVISNPIAINALFCIDDFSAKTGGTLVVPYTHKMEVLPSDEYIQKNSLTVHAKAGSVVIFDSMLFHKAGYNTSDIIRRAVNHIYSVPIMKQFYDFPKALEGKFSDNVFLGQLLGYTSQTPLDDKQWRENRAKNI
ncbi:phytanoyl-CoA dioxygenase family protein [bacterium]|nr:phytanoyl-CoA dioxygenase family protein [bacterium]MBU1990598.1 phytanoyl-CoA dioxygenase family protein [bacterium]